MIAYISFPLLILAVAIYCGKSCAWGPMKFFARWFVASIVFGIGGLFVPWHTASGFHRGSGSPIPIVIWERIQNGTYIDFPVGMALIINPLVVLLLGALCWSVTFLVRRAFTNHERKIA